MCQECGCSKPGPYQVGDRLVDSHTHTLPDGTVVTHAHPPSLRSGATSDDHHDHSHAHGQHQHGHAHPHQILNLNTGILNANDRAAEQNRGAFKALNLLALNVVSSPGAGKTTLLTKTLIELKGRLRAGVIVGDLATDNDAARLRTTGAPVVQITTGTVCHLEAEMVARAVKQLDLAGLNLLIIENVGNLVCPASYDLGEDMRVVLLSVTEGEDKPLKYPPMFQSADVVIISKIDLAQACGYDRDTALANIRRVAPKARVFETSAKTGQGLDAWREFLLQQQQARKALDPLG